MNCPSKVNYLPWSQVASILPSCHTKQTQSVIMYIGLQFELRRPWSIAFTPTALLLCIIRVNLISVLARSLCKVCVCIHATFVVWNSSEDGKPPKVEPHRKEAFRAQCLISRCGRTEQQAHRFTWNLILLIAFSIRTFYFQQFCSVSFIDKEKLSGCTQISVVDCWVIFSNRTYIGQLNR